MPLVHVVTAADVAPGAVTWIELAARAFGTLGTPSMAKRERKRGRLALNGEPTAPTNRLAVIGDRLTHAAPAADLDRDGGGGDVPDALRRARWCRICERQGLRVVYEGPSLAVLLKPVGVHVKGRGTRHVEYALPALLGPAPAEGDAALREPHAVHRLDYRVGGILLVAKTRAAEIALSGQFADHRVIKRYRAILVGRLDPSRHRPPQLEARDCGLDELIGPLLRHLGTDAAADLVVIDEAIDGRRACTAVMLRQLSRSARYGWLSTVDLWPLTGRHHQLRRHAAALGHPIIGDDLHHPTGGALPEVVRGRGLFLHAVGIRFDDLMGNRLGLDVDEPHKFGRFRHFCELNWRRQEAASTRVPGSIEATNDL